MATIDPIAHYQEAIRTLETTHQLAIQLVGTIREASDKLYNWSEVRISNVDVPFPIELPLTSTINADHWPTMQELAEALSAWHRARHEVDNAWRAIPAERRTGLQAPPTTR